MPVVQIDPRYYRPTEVDTLLGDASLARSKLNWKPKVNFRSLVVEMVEEDLKLAKREKISPMKCKVETADAWKLKNVESVETSIWSLFFIGRSIAGSISLQHQHGIYWSGACEM